VIDNLKAAVPQADWYDPELNPKLQAFAQHYRTVVRHPRAHFRGWPNGRDTYSAGGGRERVCGRIYHPE
jgi:hypothetical protein